MDCVYLESIAAGYSIELVVSTKNVDVSQYLSLGGNVKIFIDNENVTMRCLDKFSQDCTIDEILTRVKVKTSNADGGKQCVVSYGFQVDGIPYLKNYSFAILEKKETIVFTERLNELERIEKASRKIIKKAHPYANESGVIKHSLHDWGRFITEVEGL